MKYSVLLFLSVILLSSCKHTPEYMKCDECDGTGIAVLDDDESADGDNPVCDECYGEGKVLCK